MKLEDFLAEEVKDSNMHLGQNRYSVDRGRGNGGNFYISVHLSKDGKVFMTFKNDSDVSMSPANIMHISDFNNKGTAEKSKALRNAIKQATLAGKDLIPVLKKITKYNGWDLDDGSDILDREDD